MSNRLALLRLCRFDVRSGSAVPAGVFLIFGGYAASFFGGATAEVGEPGGWKVIDFPHIKAA